jgi:cytidylate kinase
MPDVLPSYGVVMDVLRPILSDLPGKLIGIDGRNGVGKTTLGRYLAWRFNVSLVESDLFMHRHTGRVEHRIEEIDRLIQFRLAKPRPVILEGITLFSILKQLNRTPDFVVYCHSANYPEGDSLEAMLEKYEAEYAPRTHADLVVNLDWNDG